MLSGTAFEVAQFYSENSKFISFAESGRQILHRNLVVNNKQVQIEGRGANNGQEERGQ